MKARRQGHLGAFPFPVYILLLYISLCALSLKELSAQSRQRQIKRTQNKSKGSRKEQALERELSISREKTPIKSMQASESKTIGGASQSDAQKSPLKEMDQSIAYPNGLYAGRLTVRFRRGGEAQKYDFRLYFKGKKRLYYFFEPSSRLVYKLLYFHHSQSKLMILGWDPLGDILHKRERKARFQKVLQSAFDYWDLALQPYSSLYGLNLQRDREENEYLQKAKNKDPYERKKFPEDLFPFPKNILSYALKAKLSSPYTRVRVQVQKERKDLARLDFYTAPGLLQKSLYPSYGEPVYDHEQKKEIVIDGRATAFRLLDFKSDRLSFLEIKSYEPRVSLKPALFDPRFIKN